MEWISIAPPLIAIGLVLWTRNVVVSLLVGICASEALLIGGNPVMGFLNTLERVANVFQSPGNTRLLLFGLVIGAFLGLIRYSGGVAALVDRLVKSGTVNTPRRSGLLAFGLGTILFVETNLSLLTSGVAARGLFDRFKMSRARLAYIIDSTSAPISSIILLNGWGAYLLGLLSQDERLDSPVGTLMNATALNLYCWIALALTLFVVWTGKTHGPMATAEQEEHKATAALEPIEKPTKARFMIVPMITLVGGIFGFLWWTGEGDILAGSGSQSMLWATGVSIFVAALIVLIYRRFTLSEVSEVSFKGIGEILPVVTILLLSIAFGNSLDDLGTGPFVAQILSGALPIWLAAPVIFMVTGFIAFTTGTSWGTFAIAIPIALPLALALGVPPALLVAAVIGGGVFGDHCSPISDTTVMASLAAGVDHIDHVRTQLPYALFGGGLTLIGYAVLGIIASIA